MPNCPDCKTPGAYIGFNTIECRNPRCTHFSIEEEDICPCCGKKGHTPGVDFLKKLRADPNTTPPHIPHLNQPSAGD
ncbi:MAG: hypothetical protein WCT04_19825 [Planctomycetota bacterium]